MARLKAYLCARLSLYAAVAAALLAVNLTHPSDYLKQGSFWAVAVLIVAIPLDALRFRAARSPPAPDEGLTTSLRGSAGARKVAATSHGEGGQRDRSCDNLL